MSARTHQSAAVAAAPPSSPSVARSKMICTAAVFAFSLGLYSWTLAPTVTLVDSGELIVAAQGLGVAHPPGFPLYVLLAHIASLVPIGRIAVRVNFASAFFAALATSVSALAVLEVVDTCLDKTTGGSTSKSRKRKGSTTARVKITTHQPNLPGWLSSAPALAAGLLFGTSRTLWAYATVTEVYTLNSFLIALIVFFMFRWRRLVLMEHERTGRLDSLPGAHDRWLNAAALTFGLALGVHHVTVGLVLPAFAVLVLMTEGLTFFTSKRLPVAAAFACAGLCVYIYLPLAAAHAPIMNWGNPRTFDRFIAHVTGWQYRVFFEAQPERIGHQLADFFERALREFGPAWLPVALAMAMAGFIYLSRRTRAIFWFLLIVVAANLAYNVNYEIAEDKDAYYLPVFLSFTLASAFGVRSVIEWLFRKPWRTLWPKRAIAAALVVAIPGVAFASNLAFDNRRDYFIARDYVENILSTVGPDGMLLTLDWQVYSPMFYLREIEAYRRDVVVIDVNQLRRSWYFNYLARAYPRTMSQARDQVDAFLEDLRHWERDPEIYQRDASLNRRISARFRDLILALTVNHSRSAPVYVTQEIATYGSGGSDSDWVQQIVQKYQLVPQGLVFQLFGDQQFHEPVHPALATRGLVDGSLRFDADDVVKVKILPVYAGMSYNRGRYLAAANRDEEAIEAFKEALTIDPGLAVAQRALAESQHRIRRPS